MSTQCLDSISEKIQEKCVEAGYKKTQVSTACGVGKDFFSNMGKGSFPSLDKIIKIADFLGVSIDDLIGRPTHMTYGNVTGNNSGNAGNTNCSFGAPTCSEEAQEIDHMLKSLSFKDRAQLMNIIVEFVENHKT